MSRLNLRRLLTGALAGAVVAGVGALAAPAASAADLPRPVVSHTVVQANEHFTVSVTGCTARPGGSKPWLTLTSPDTPLLGDGGQSYPDGSFEFREVFGPATPKGTYRIQVVCDDYLGQRSYPLAAITFGALPVPAECASGCATVGPGQSIAPAAGVVPGGKLALLLTGYLPLEKVRLALHSTPQDLGEDQADASGRMAFALTVPAGTPAGLHHLVVTRADGSTVRYPVTVAAAPAAARPTLANTGADVTLPLVIGGALVVAGAGAIVAARGRGRQGASA
ncbi:hypothetical protein [Blastococcus sp. TBT05-19]|uniref:hypothetical protein n=1 Tax=Blastococcus sp. TBT05-19 TaxID=2250581 RepID=UPI001314BD91|nr:hypothetical protein [Blastococcus sp. TBT05-19]